MHSKGLSFAAVVLLLLCAAALAFAEGGAPDYNAEGFLDEGEYVYTDPDLGIWHYCSPTLRVDITRCTQTQPNLVWYEAEIRTRGDERWRLATAEEGKHISASTWPWLIARHNGCVFAINNDFAQFRYPKKNKSVGIMIRDGKIFSAKTSAAGKKGVPNLDTLALMPDGSFAVFRSNELKAQDYLDMGCMDVLCFGPYLIRDGVLNEDGIKKAGTSNSPRTAVGMVENGHYFAMVLEGRHKGSVGAPVSFLAYRMMERGCTVAINLDGGETSVMLFMGEQINKVGGTNNKGGSARRSSEILAVGTSELVPAK